MDRWGQDRYFNLILGFGVFFYADGSKYVGYWLNNKKHGKSLYLNEIG